ncbi:MAG: arylamine N-acetyltransferase [Chloroflexi bacterium]|nr:arylamine N-acetyltransferase [Chloroflexota bacterium]
MVQPLPAPLVDAVLAHLGVPVTQPDIATLDRLVSAYTRRVPWESASRIARRAAVQAAADCPRWPEEFWQTAMEQGTGGTCYESNYAFFSLLVALGYRGYLTINDMETLIGCHSAIIVYGDDNRWLVDVGLPLHAPLPLPESDTTSRATPFLRYTVRPLKPARYQIEREPHPRPYCFILVDEPIPDAPYRAVTAADYGPDGQFLDRIIINKVIDERLWRFNSAEPPYHLEIFENGERMDIPITSDVPISVAQHFGMDEAVVTAAFGTLGLER